MQYKAPDNTHTPNPTYRTNCPRRRTNNGFATPSSCRAIDDRDLRLTGGRDAATAAFPLSRRRSSSPPEAPLALGWLPSPLSQDTATPTAVKASLRALNCGGGSPAVRLDRVRWAARPSTGSKIY